MGSFPKTFDTFWMVKLCFFSKMAADKLKKFQNCQILIFLFFLREAHGNNEPEGRVLRALRARYTSPLGRVVECVGWSNRVL